MKQRICRSLPTLSSQDDRRLGFYAALWDEPTVVYDYRPGAKERSNYTEVVRAGAFLDSLKGETEVLATVDHDPGRTFARRSTGELILQEDPKGLFVSCWLPDNDLGNRVLADVKNGTLNGASFRFVPMRERWEGDTCELLAVSLADVCLTDKPAYKATQGEVHVRTSSVKINELFTRLRFVKLKARSINTLLDSRRLNEEKSI